MKPWRHLFLVAPDCHAPAGHYSTLWRRHFYEGFQGCDVSIETPSNVDFSFAYGAASPGKGSEAFAEANERLRRQIFDAQNRNELDVVISYARDREISHELVAETIRRGVPWVNFYCDSVGQFALVKKIARVASLNWFPESSAAAQYLAVGRPSICRPYVLNRDALPEVASFSDDTGRIGFVGVPSTNRVTILSLLRCLGCSVEIHGYGWQNPNETAFGGNSSAWEKLARLLKEPHRLERLWRRVAWKHLQRVAKGPLDDQKLHRFLGQCRLVLGLNDARDPRGVLQSYLKFRDLEMPGYGCCYLTQRNADIESLLTPGEQVLIFESVWEARSLIKFYEKRPDLCRAIGRSARERILREHNWATRLGELRAAVA